MLISSSRKSSRFICLLLSPFYDHRQPGFPGISLSVLCLIMYLITAWCLGIHIGFRRNKAGIQIIALAVQKFLNIGCGVVFANYDGKVKAKTKVGDGCFIGSNCNIVAPVTLGAGAYVAAGTTLTRDLQPLDFCIGREREKVKPQGAAGRYKNG